MTEHSSHHYAPRTALNVKDSDFTLVITNGRRTPGTELTLKLINQYGKPFLHITADGSRTFLETARVVSSELRNSDSKVMNVAGPRLSSWRAGYQKSFFIVRLLVAESMIA
jgi:DNA-binding MurR/RpiR family transcriptional regulator